MAWIRTILREVLGLFVDDGAFALAILAWIGIDWLLAGSLHLGTAASVLLFVGLAVILLESTTRFSRMSRER